MSRTVVRFLLYVTVVAIFVILIYLNTYSYFKGTKLLSSLKQFNSGKFSHVATGKDQPPYASYKVIKKKAKDYLHGGVPIHDLDYLNNNKIICKAKKKPVKRLLVVFMIHSHPNDFRARRLVRSTWTNRRLMKMLKARKAFIMGRSKNDTINRQIDDEARDYDDIIQEDFVDSFRNSTFTNVFTLRWLKKRCPNAKFVVKVDADYLVNIFALTAFLRSIPKVSRSIICEVRESAKDLKVVRDKKDLYYVSEEQYPASTYKKYCNPGMWIITRDVIDEFYAATWHVPYLPFGNIYTTGLLPHYVGNITHHPKQIFSPLSTSDDFYKAQDVLSFAFLPHWRDYKRVWVKVVKGVQKAAMKMHI